MAVKYVDGGPPVPNTEYQVDPGIVAVDVCADPSIEHVTVFGVVPLVITNV